jgi:hypothetical protein
MQPDTGQAGRPDKPEHNNGTSHRGMFSRINDARAGVAYQQLGPGVTLEFRVKYIGLADAARLGILLGTLYKLLGEAREPDPEDMDGLTAAQHEARRVSEADRLAQITQSLADGRRVVEDVVEAVRDLDDPDVWRPVKWVSSDAEEGEDENEVRLCADRVLTPEGLSNIISVALFPASEVAGRWRPFLER